MPPPPDRSPAGPEPIRVLVRRPELCLVDANGVAVLVQLTPMRAEWLAELRAAHIELEIRHGSPRPLVALVRLDRRFPLEVGFDQNLGELRHALQLVRPHLAACAVIVGFGGVVGFVMHRALRVIGFLGRRDLPTHVGSSAAEAVSWIAPYATPTAAGPFDPSACIEALREVEALLDVP